MDLNLCTDEELIARFRKKYARIPQCGTFTKSKREKIMGTKGVSGRDVRKADFWQDVRDHIRAALLDIQLFLTFASESDKSLVMTVENLYPIIHGLMFKRNVATVERDLRKAEIAHVFIDKGFHYLAYASTQASLTLSHKRTINEALDLANYLVQSFKPEKERNYIAGGLLP
jgi:hypothetical protein